MERKVIHNMWITFLFLQIWSQVKILFFKRQFVMIIVVKIILKNLLESEEQL